MDEHSQVADLSREFEDRHLAETLDIIRHNIADYEAQTAEMEADIKDMQDHFHDGDTELLQTLENTITLHDSIYNALQRNLRALKKPYFGRILFTDCSGLTDTSSAEAATSPAESASSSATAGTSSSMAAISPAETASRSQGAVESLYIGRAGVSSGLTEQVVIDWRAPIANVYYENGLGRASYTPPAGKPITLDLKLKRTFDIDGGLITGYFDSEAAANDEFLNRYLARSKQAVLGEIIATIQKEQNDIIRKSPLHNVLVQGAAGSGKTTVAMHRISYILYNYPDRIRPADFYIIGSNRMLLAYITGVLPELDVQGFRQMTMEQLFVRLLYETWDEGRYAVSENVRSDGYAALRGSAEWYGKLMAFTDAFRTGYIKQAMADRSDEPLSGQTFADILLEPMRFVESVEGGRSGVFDRRGTANTDLHDPNGLKSKPVILMRGSYIERFVSENPNMSLQNVLETLNERLADNLEQELMLKDIKYTAKEKAAIRQAYRNYFLTGRLKVSVYSIYNDFLAEQGCPQPGRITLAEAASGAAYGAKAARTGLDVYDLAALAFIYKRIVESDTISEAHHIVIDEAQDYGMMAYSALKYCIRDCTYTVMGDISQNIRYDSGLNDWQALRQLLLTDPRDSFCTLRKSYRNTIEISDFATAILDHGSFEVYPVEPIIRHGRAPFFEKVTEDTELPRLAELYRKWQADGLTTIAIICPDQAQAAALAKRLGQLISLTLCDGEQALPGSGLIVLPISLTKGLEFDAVILYNPSPEAYPVDDRHAKLLYVAATRALHELALVYRDRLTGLITDPVPEGKKRRVIADSGQTGPGISRKVSELNAGYSEAREEEYVKQQILKQASVKTAVKYGIRSADAKAGSDAAAVRSGLPGGSIQSSGPLSSAATGSAALMPGSGSHGLTAPFSASHSPAPADSGQLSSAAAGSAASDSADSSGICFAAKAPADIFRLPGHAAPALSVKWVNRQADGIYLQSRFGVMRICPISPCLARISFCKGPAFTRPEPVLTKSFNMLKNYQYREKGSQLEIILPRLIISVDKLTGVITYKNGNGRELLKEKNPEPRYIDASGICVNQFAVKGSEDFHAYNGSENMKYIKGEAYYVSPDSGKAPMLLVKDRYCIIQALPGRTAFMNKPGAGTCLLTEGSCQDIYFAAADSTGELLDIYAKLTDRLP